MFRGDTGKVRKVIFKMGGNEDCYIFNDKRKTFRRLKIWTAKEFMYTYTFKEELAKIFGDRFIDAKPIKTYRGKYSYAIYLKN